MFHKWNEKKCTFIKKIFIFKENLTLDLTLKN